MHRNKNVHVGAYKNNDMWPTPYISRLRIINAYAYLNRKDKSHDVKLCKHVVNNTI